MQADLCLWVLTEEELAVLDWPISSFADYLCASFNWSDSTWDSASALCIHAYWVMVSLNEKIRHECSADLMIHNRQTAEKCYSQPKFIKQTFPLFPIRWYFALFQVELCRKNCTNKLNPPRCSSVLKTKVTVLNKLRHPLIWPHANSKTNTTCLWSGQCRLAHLNKSETPSDSASGFPVEL